METLKIRNLMSSTKKKKENFEFLEEACPCRFLISEIKLTKLMSTENLYCAKIKKKKLYLDGPILFVKKLLQGPCSSLDLRGPVAVLGKASTAGCCR